MDIAQITRPGQSNTSRNFGQNERTALTLPGHRDHARVRLAAEIRRAEETNQEFSVALVEFAGLSELTECLGPTGGEDVWRHVLGLLRYDLRPRDLCCHFGGDEFMLILPTKGRHASRELVERILSMWDPVAGTRAASVEVSAGIACYPGDGTTVERLLESADATMQSSDTRAEFFRLAV